MDDKKSLLLNLKGEHPEKLEWLKSNTGKDYSEVLRTALDRYYISETRKYSQLQARRQFYQQQIKTTKDAVTK